MRESVRAYLTAGLSTVAVGALIATPMSPLPRQAASPRPQVRVNDVHLAALSAPSASTGLADQSQSVHLLAEVSRGLASMKAASAASTGRANPLLSSAAPIRADVPTGVVTAQNPATADAPDSDNRQAVTAPQSAAVNAIDAPAIAGVLATATQLALDTFITSPATFVQGTVANLNQVILAAGTLDPDAVSQALQGFVFGEQLTIGVVATGLVADLNSLSDALGRLDPAEDGGDVGTASMLAKTTRPATEAGADESDAADEATSNEQRGDVVDAGSERHVVAGKDSHDGSSGSTPSQETVGDKDNAVTTAKQSDSKVSESSNRNPTDAQADDTSNPKGGDGSGSKEDTANATDSSKSNASDSKRGGTSEANHTKKADHSGGQSTGKTSNPGGRHSKHDA